MRKSHLHFFLALLLALCLSAAPACADASSPDLPEKDLLLPIAADQYLYFSFSTNVMGYTNTANGFRIESPDLYPFFTAKDTRYLGFFLLQENGLLALVNGPEGIVTEALWDDIQAFSPSAVMVCKDGKWGTMSLQGEIITPPAWDFYYGVPSELLETGYSFAIQDGNVLLIDISGRTLSEPLWDDCGWFSEGLGMVCRDNKWGYINTEGEEVIPCQWEYVGPFEGGVAEVQQENGLYGLISTDGTVLCEPQYLWMGACREGLRAVQTDKYPDLWGYLDTQGNMVIPPQYEDAGNFSEGLAPAKKDGKWGFIDTSGQFVIEPVWDYAQPFANGRARVQRDGLHGCIDTQGNIVIQPEWQYILPLTDHSYEITGLENDTEVYFITDLNGNRPNDHTWDSLRFILNEYGLYRVCKDGLYGWINGNGDVVVDAVWLDSEPFINGFSRVRSATGVGFVDVHGNVAVEPVWDAAAPFIHDTTYVIQNGEYFLIDQSGNIRP